MDKKDFEKTTKVFLTRLESNIIFSSCNDLSIDEFNKSICNKFNSDNELFEEWKKTLCENLKMR